MLRSTHSRVRSILEEVKKKKLIDEFNIIYVDDGSSDGTFELLDEYSQEEKFVKVISFSKNFGHQAALSAGLRVAEGDAVISLDADLQDPPELIEEMLICYRDGFEIVYGVRNDREEDTFFKRLSATGFYKLMQWLGVPIVPHHAEFRLVSRQVLEAFKQHGEVNMFLRGLFPLIGFKHCTVKYKR
ncbi:MAG: glycosyltransferase family 2 protein, partial [Lentimicrobiaceae bacterium]|nr:glycosyltransferase family 2 protein [Lentimicrobiaceae bacterium]